MTKEELTEKWISVPYSEWILDRDLFLSDLNEVIRGELIKFDAWGYGCLPDSKAIIDDVDEYLKQQK